MMAAVTSFVEAVPPTSPAEVADLERLRLLREQAEAALHTLVVSEHVIDRDFIERSKSLRAAAEAARAAHEARWRELFD